MRLRAKTAIIFVLLVIVPLGAGLLVSFHALSDYLAHHQYAIIRQSAEQLDDLIDMEKADVLAVSQALSELASVQAAIQAKDPEALRSVARVYERLVRTDVIEFRDVSGRVLVRTERGRPQSTLNPLPANPSKTNQPQVDIYPSGSDIVIRATAPIIKGTTKIGEASVGERLSGRFIERYKQGLGFEIAVLSHDRVLYSTLPRLQAELLPLETIDSARGLFYERTEINGSPYSLAGYPLLGPHGEYQGALLLFGPETTMRAALSRAQHAIVIVGALTLLYALSVGYVVNRRLQAPIFKLLSKMRSVRKGNYNVKVDVRSRDEFMDLADGFNRMLRQIRSSRRRLRTQNRRLQELAGNLKRELQVAGQVQDLLIPKDYDDDLVAVRVQYFPMLEVGGDYAFFRVDRNRVGYFLIADVSGHGVAAALVMSSVSSQVENLVHSGMSVQSLLWHLNRFIFEHFSATGAYLSLFCARVDFNNAVLEYASAGHPPQMLFRADGRECTELKAMNLPLGVFPPNDFGEPVVRSLPFQKGDLLVLFTDGWIEITGEDDKELGVGGFRRILESGFKDGGEWALERILERVKRYGGRFDDDALLVAVRFLTGPGVSQVRGGEDSVRRVHLREEVTKLQ